MPAPCCQSCSSGIYDDSILLWDGKDYCRNCVSLESLRLARFAAENRKLACTIPREAGQVRKFMAYMGPQDLLFLLVFLECHREWPRCYAWPCLGVSANSGSQTNEPRPPT